MAQVSVRDPPDETAARPEARAAEAGRSLEAELRDILNQAAQPSHEQRKREALRKVRASSRPWQPGEPTAAGTIRGDRAPR
jgi:plasmid stability protein